MPRRGPEARAAADQPFIRQLVQDGAGRRIQGRRIADAALDIRSNSIPRPGAGYAANSLKPSPIVLAPDEPIGRPIASDRRNSWHVIDVVLLHPRAAEASGPI